MDARFGLSLKLNDGPSQTFNDCVSYTFAKVKIPSPILHFLLDAYISSAEVLSLMVLGRRGHS